MLKLFIAVCLVESGNDPDAVNQKEQAYGVAQIRQCCVDDLNRHYRTDFKLHDFTDPRLSAWAFHHYGLMYGAKTPEEFARIWNGGPDGAEQNCTLEYWERVKRRIEDVSRHEKND